MVGRLETLHIELTYFCEQAVPALLQILGQNRKLVNLPLDFLPLVAVLLVDNVVDERDNDLVDLFVGGVEFLLYRWRGYPLQFGFYSLVHAVGDEVYFLLHYSSQLLLGNPPRFGLLE